MVPDREEIVRQATKAAAQARKTIKDKAGAAGFDISSTTVGSLVVAVEMLLALINLDHQQAHAEAVRAQDALSRAAKAVNK